MQKHAPVKNIEVLFLYSPCCLTAIDTANNDPHKDPYRTEEGDDTVEKMVRTVISHLQEGGKKGRHKPQFKR